MKVLLVVVLIAFVIQASAQDMPSLRCYECADCSRVEDSTPLVECYQAATVPTRLTDPATISLTPTVPTTTGLPTQPTTTPAPTQAPAGPVEGFVDVAAARNMRTFTCYVIQADIGNRRIVSRGCGLISATKEDTCRYHNSWEDPAECSLCDEHGCNDMNGVTGIFASVSLIFASLFIALRLR